MIEGAQVEVVREHLLDCGELPWEGGLLAAGEVCARKTASSLPRGRTGRSTEVSRTFSTIRCARKQADSYRGYADNVRIMQGGPGGMEVA